MTQLLGSLDPPSSVILSQRAGRPATHVSRTRALTEVIAPTDSTHKQRLQVERPLSVATFRPVGGHHWTEAATQLCHIGSNP